MNAYDNTLDLDPPGFERLAAIARTITPDDHRLDAPPAGLWDAIAMRLRADEDHAEPTVLAVTVPAATAATTTRTSAPSSIAGVGRARATRRYAPVLLAAAVVVAVAGLVATFALGGDDHGTVIEAAAPLLSLDGANTELAQAELVTDDGTRAVRIRLEQLDLPDDGFLELWVIDTDVVGMHSLGVVADDGTFTLPPGLDPAEFPVVDISIEPVDGDPTHSGVSVARGVLVAPG